MDEHLASLRAVHVPGRLNGGADLLSRGGPQVRKWRLHPRIVAQIWDRFDRAEVDLFLRLQKTRPTADGARARYPIVMCFILLLETVVLSITQRDCLPKERIDSKPPLQVEFVSNPTALLFYVTRRYICIMAWPTYVHLPGVQNTSFVFYIVYMFPANQLNHIINVLLKYFC